MKKNNEIDQMLAMRSIVTDQSAENAFKEIRPNAQMKFKDVIANLSEN